MQAHAAMTMTEFYSASKPCSEKTDLMFPDYDPESTVETEFARIEALGVIDEFCKHCPVRAQCLEYAVTTDNEFGVWGGYWFDDPKSRGNARRSHAGRLDNAKRKNRGRYLTLDDRRVIADGLALGHPIPQIAGELGKSRKTIWTEVNKRSREGIYSPHEAHEEAKIKREDAA